MTSRSRWHKGPSELADRAQPAAAPRPSDDVDAAASGGERLAVPERVIVAPAAGRFRAADRPAHEGYDVDRGQVVGLVEGLRRLTPVISPFQGRFLGLLAYDGERVREGEPVAWIRVTIAPDSPQPESAQPQP